MGRHETAKYSETNDCFNLKYGLRDLDFEPQRHVAVFVALLSMLLSCSNIRPCRCCFEKVSENYSPDATCLILRNFGHEATEKVRGLAAVKMLRKIQTLNQKFQVYH